MVEVDARSLDVRWVDKDPDLPTQVRQRLAANELLGPRMSSKRRRTAVPREELVPGTALTASLKDRTFSATVVLGDEGKPEVELDGARYPSLSAAGKAAAGYPVNGWRFWRPVEQSQE